MDNITKKPEASPRKDGLIDVPSHLIADGLGALIGGAAAGAVVGTVAGPVGIAVGAVAGAIAGGLGADAVANSVDEVREDAHWRANFQNRPYVADGASYEDFAPAYQLGIVSYGLHPDKDFDDVAVDLSDEWNSTKGRSTLAWEAASPAARDAWERLVALQRADGVNR